MKYTVIIATSQKRSKLLVSRSLNSIYHQTKIDKSECSVIIVDDNKSDHQIPIIKAQIAKLRAELKLNPKDFPTNVLKNSRTRYMSGTGAWNTGLLEAYKLNPDGFISILDDDDEYLPNHLSDCIKAIKDNTVAVFQRLIWINADGTKMDLELTREKLTVNNFFIGNPGIQGSNMFFRTKNIIDIKGFDESLPNTTDRDLMIRFLWKNKTENIEILENVGINHYNHTGPKVNNDISKKQIGLDLFYKKYKSHFSQGEYQKSLMRAKKYFSYEPGEQIIICMPLKNAEGTLEKAITSVLDQTSTKREIILLIGNDNSTDGSAKKLNEFTSQHSNIVILNVDFNKAYLNRNFLNDYARKNFPNCVLIGRLDADDFIHDKTTISHIEKLFDQTDFDVLLCGNKQMKNGVILNWENRPTKRLLEDNFLLDQLYQMSEGKPKAELPSCNTFIKPTVKVNYPPKQSAEDHWFTVSLLLQKELNIQIEENLIYSVYSLDGDTTADNRKSKIYFEVRKELVRYFKQKTIKRNIYFNWKKYINENGLSFHEYNIKKNKEKLEKYWSESCPVNKRIEAEIKNLPTGRINLLDVGCGPFPKSGVYYKGNEIKRVLIDAMAKEYHLLLNNNGINTYGQKITCCNAEEVESVFKKKSFDIIYSKNALDHTYNPIKAIKQLANLLNENGIMILEHYLNEGEYTNYFGLHQWNFSIEKGSFYISDQTKKIRKNINELLSDFKVKSTIEGNKIINLISKS